MIKTDKCFYAIIERMSKQKSTGTQKHNQVYQRNDSAIKRVVFLLNGQYRGRVTARQIAKATGLTRQAVYNHCFSTKSVVADSEQAILAEFSADMDVQTKKLFTVIPDANTRLFYATLVFISHRREIFSPICSDMHNQGVLYQMVELLYARLEIVWLPKGAPTPEIGSDRADMLIHMLSEVVCKWSVSTNCDIRKANRCIRRMLRATSDAASNRLP